MGGNMKNKEETLRRGGVDNASEVGGLKPQKIA